jgi:hypothetical protein
MVGFPAYKEHEVGEIPWYRFLALYKALSGDESIVTESDRQTALVADIKARRAAGQGLNLREVPPELIATMVRGR